MARIVTYMIILSGLMLLMAFAGLPTASHEILSAFGILDSSGALSLDNIENSWIVNHLSTIVFISLAAAIIAGLFSRQINESFILGTLCGYLLIWGITDMLSIVLYFSGIGGWHGSDISFISYLIAAIFLPLLVGYVISMIQWWRGNDI